ncbi:hypothetical protein CK203_029610 [Vitis vinifera]|uniref:Uncharacterized protein n=1 Tax=Vitis vinifera TaxID=29760 RepID=A0A438JCA2_VITVI|nr:hypothetical protein CK203_029610 [Vitis vinifera]
MSVHIGGKEVDREGYQRLVGQLITSHTLVQTLPLLSVLVSQLCTIPRKIIYKQYLESLDISKGLLEEDCCSLNKTRVLMWKLLLMLIGQVLWMIEGLPQVITFLGENLITWRSKKQRCCEVYTEAEFRTLALNL